MSKGLLIHPAYAGNAKKTRFMLFLLDAKNAI